MIRLVRVELTRLRWRRAVLLLLLTCFVAPVVIWAGTAWETRPYSADEVAEAERQVAAEAEQPYVARELRRCQERPEKVGGPGTTAEQCTEMVMPRIENYLWRAPLEVSEVADAQGAAVMVIISALLLILGTTFAGHDWNTGSMSNQLLFEPRRVRVWLAKAVAVCLTGALVTTGALALFWGLTALLAAQRDVGVSSATWEAVAALSLRGIALAALAGLVGFALTMLFRSTVATLGVGFAASVGSSVLLFAVLGPRAEGWLPSSNFLAILQDGYEYYDYSAECEAFQMGQGMPSAEGEPSMDPCMAEIGLTQGVVYWGVLLVVVVALSVLSFRRRDVP